ncbi:MAG: RNA polymerase sigma factor [Chloroflexi bacterium]|nr:RNA polymerase sigma factor [Chloroflexota bacterium]
MGSERDNAGKKDVDDVCAVDGAGGAVLPAPRCEEDAALMCRARDGDVGSFSQLFDRHRRRVEQFLFRLFRNREKAEDGTQEVFVRLWIARRRYEARGQFTTFLYQIAHNYWRDEIRKMHVRPAEVEITLEAETRPGSLMLRAPAATEPHYQLLLNYQQWRIRDAIGRLPEIYRAAFVLVHLEDRKIVEAAEILELPVGTVKSRLHTATRLLRDRLAEPSEERGER